MSDEEDDAYRAKIAAQTMRWRLGLGVSSWGIAAAGIGVIALVMFDATIVHVVGRGRLLTYMIPTVLTFFAAGYVLLRVGEIDLATGRLTRAAPVPWSRIVGLVTVATLLIAAILAWPLGVYTSLRAAHSSCGSRVPIETLRAFTTEPLSYHSVSEDGGECDVMIVAEGRAEAAALLRERPVPDDHEWRSQLTRFHPDRRETLAIDDGEAVLLENADAFVIAVRRDTTGMFVQLRRGVFDYDDAIVIARDL